MGSSQRFLTRYLSQILAVILRAGVYCDTIDVKDYVALFTLYMECLCDAETIGGTASSVADFSTIRYAEVVHFCCCDCCLASSLCTQRASVGYRQVDQRLSLRPRPVYEGEVRAGHAMHTVCAAEASISSIGNIFRSPAVVGQGIHDALRFHS